ncbi:MAG: hypothetical protein Q7V15_02095 [Phenylobacterium sp.]|uniref:hypothetical protein n=1 Tax=Phenylobacterium sp. TaxID=1871053 RepID=UPI00271973D0|nr:hypothetical protein [Phenylobacterium sp.]MDO8900125.1 hypothetical protein [Phenylobacterium sp.]
MRIALEGWGRNHGEKVLFAKSIDPSNYKAEPGTINLNQYEVTTHSVRVNGVDKTRVGVRFGISNLRTGGDYQGSVRFSPEDAALIFALAFRDKPLETVLAALADARDGLAVDESEEQAA